MMRYWSSRCCDGTEVACNVVVKVAVSGDQKDGLQNEYDIYEHLAAKQAQGVPVVPAGLFAERKSLSLPQNAFVGVLGAIHTAGVIRSDLRAPNLLVDDAGDVAMIDFDGACRSSSREARAEERAELDRVLDNL
ncbi:hypothetical protein BKA93DRAFT_825771 [Sparassis latifolia]